MTSKNHHSVLNKRTKTPENSEVFLGKGKYGFTSKLGNPELIIIIMIIVNHFLVVESRTLKDTRLGARQPGF